MKKTGFWTKLSMIIAVGQLAYSIYQQFRLYKEQRTKR